MAGARVFAPLRSGDYRLLWSAQLVSVIGDKIHQIAMSVLVYKLTGSVAQVGVMLAVTTLPAVLFGVPAGVFVDRWDRRVTMIGSDLIRAAVVVCIPLLVPYGMMAVYAAAFCVATVSLFFEPARLSLIPQVVKPDELMAANSLDNMSQSASELLGLIGAASVVALVGTSAAFLLDGVTFVVSAVFVVFVSTRGRALSPGGTRQRFLAELQGGLKHIVDVPVLRDLVGVYALAGACIAAAILAVNGLAFQRFGSGAVDSRAVGLALLDGAITAGLLVGSLTVGQSGSTAAGRKFLVSLTVFGVSFGLVAYAPSLVAAMPLLFIGGVANMWFFVPGSTLIQTTANPAVLGRVFAAKNAVSRVSITAGFLLAGFAAERIGLKSTVLAFGGTLVVVSLLGWTSRALREA